MKTISYIKKCKKQKSSRNVQATKRYLKEQKLLAIPFDKGVGICLMKREDYEKKLDAILELPQFEKVILKRKNAKHPVISEQERIVSRTDARYRSNCIITSWGTPAAVQLA